MADRDRIAELRIDRSEAPRENPWPRRIAVLGAVLVVLAVAVWLLVGSRAVEVETVTVVASGEGGAAGKASVLDASGYVVARRRSTVSAKVTGRLVRVAIEEGTAVEKGQVLARLDDANARRALALAEAGAAAARSAIAEIRVDLREADLDLSRIRALADDGIASRAELDRAEAARDGAAARLAATEATAEVAAREVDLRRQELEDTRIRAPFDGVAISKDAQPGEIVSPMSAGGGFTRTGIGTIVDMSSLEIEVDVNEAFIQRVTPGQEVIARLDAYPDWRIPARVITTVPTADRQKATVRVRIGFVELGDPRILPDMGVKVAFQAADDDGGEAEARRILVPRAAIVRDGDRRIVFVVRGERVERRAVDVGGSFGDGVEVVAGVRAGETLVVDPPEGLSDGAPVRRSGR